jgi:hypothetical protein
MPWEGALLAMLFRGLGTARYDVALAISFGCSLVMPSELREIRPYAIFHFDGSSLNVSSRHHVVKNTQFRIGTEEILLWTYDGKAHNSSGSGRQLLLAARNPGSADPAVCARIGSLPAKGRMGTQVNDVITIALIGDQFDIFCIATAYRKQMVEKGVHFPERPTASDLHFLARMTKPDKYLARLGGVEELLHTADPLQSLAQAAPNPQLLRRVCNAFIAKGVDLHDTIASAPVGAGAPLSLLASHPEGFRVCLEYCPPSDLPNLYPLLKVARILSLDWARSFLTVLQQESITNIFSSEQEHAELLL